VCGKPKTRSNVGGVGKPTVRNGEHLLANVRSRSSASVGDSDLRVVGRQVPRKGLCQERGPNRPVVTHITPETQRSSPGQGEATGNRGGGLKQF